MITIGFSTRVHNQDFIDYLKHSSGIDDVEIIEKVNNGIKSLPQVYNEIIKEAKNDYIILCHDDIYFDTKKFGQKILNHFEKSEYGILGVAGTTFLPKSGMWWEDRSKMIGIVNHENDNKKWESRYSKDLGSEIKSTVIVDGVFLAIDRKRIKSTFDENYKGFHLYDVSFCFKNYLESVKVGVIFNVRLTHKSIGQVNQQWEENRVKFSKENLDQLPQKIQLTKNDSLNILFLTDDVSEQLPHIESLVKNNQRVTLICNTIDHNLKKVLKKLKVEFYKVSEIPGYKLGDGRSPVKTSNGVVKSVLGEYYKISDVNYDLIFCDSNTLFHTIKILYSLTPKISTKEINVEHNSIVNYINRGYEGDLHNLILESINQMPQEKSKIKILTGYSDKGGSTVAFINLTNYLNKIGFDCTMYGPHKWHLDKCKADSIKNYVLEKNDRLITHVLNLNERPQVEKVIYVSHEKWWYPVGKLNMYWDKAVFLHEQHRKYHSDYRGPYEIIPNLKEDLKKNTKKDGVEMIAGVIGTIEDRKQTHLSIKRALDDGCVKVKVFGKIGEDPQYYKDNIEPLLSDGKVEVCGFSDNKQEMYDSIGRVYHMSKGEVACLVKDECFLTDTLFFGNEETNHDVSELTNEQIMNLWIKILGY